VQHFPKKTTENFELLERKSIFFKQNRLHMRKFLRYLLVIVLILVVLTGGFAAFVAIRGVPHYTAENISLKVAITPERVQRGMQLSAMLCNDCHLNETTGKLTGRKMEEVPQFGAVYSRNITQDRVHGIGNWTDGQLAYLLRTGVRPDGRFLPIMAKLQKMSDEDLHSIIAFLRSDNQWVKADPTTNNDSKYSFLAKFLTTIKAVKPMEFAHQPIPEPDTANAVKWGEYVGLYRVECYACHSADFATDDFNEPEKSKGFFGGGNEFALPNGSKIRSRNLTMDEETGIGRWTEADFVKAVKTGIVPNGQSPLRPPMKPYVFLSDGEVKAIYAYLKTIPKIKNKVDRGL
jgi:mono/diheme cytochrome c family protein